MNRTLLLALLITATPTLAQTTILTEDFETDGSGTRYTLSFEDDGDEVDDYFRRTDGSDIDAGAGNGNDAFAGSADGFYFAAQDIDGIETDADGVAGEQQTLTISGIDISAYTRLVLSIDVAEGDDGTNEDWDPEDFVHASFTLDETDPTSYETGYAIWFDNNPTLGTPATGINAPPFLNYDFDNDGGDSPEDREVTNVFTTFSRELGFSNADASIVDLVITFDLDDGDTDIAIDNIVLVGFTDNGVRSSSTVGWRQLSPPVTYTIDQIADLNLVSGAGGYVTGANCQVGDVTNIFTRYTGQETGAFGGYVQPDAGTSVQPGEGFFWYFFGENPGAGFPDECSNGGATSTTQALPITLPSPDNGATTDQTVVVANADDEDGFYLLGNPFAEAFDIDGISATVGVQDDVQSWDPDQGMYVVIEADGAGDITDADADDVSIWQGFWVERTDSADPGTDVTFTFDADAQVGNARGDGFVARRGDRQTRIALEVTNGDLRGAAAVVRFTDAAGEGWDRQDLSKIGSFTAQYAQVGPVGIGRDGAVQTKAVESRSLDLTGSTEIPIAFTTTASAGEFTLTWPDLSLNDGWVATLTDKLNGTTVDLAVTGSLTFAYTPGDDAERFVLTVVNAATDSETGPALAEVGAVYPNPTAGSARLAVTVVEAQAVTVTVFDAVGRRVAVAFDGQMAPGATSAVDLATGMLAPGIYVVRVQGARFMETRRLVVTR